MVCLDHGFMFERRSTKLFGERVHCVLREVGGKAYRSEGAEHVGRGDEMFCVKWQEEDRWTRGEADARVEV